MADPKRRTVAIVDDDHAVRDALGFLLTVVGHEIEMFASAAEFLKADIQHVACLLLDHHMPHMTGLELAERLRAAGVTIPIMLLTALPSRAIAAHAAKIGIEIVLEKPPNEVAMLGFVAAATG
jgi:FixJ family two-component response regulator